MSNGYPVRPDIEERALMPRSAPPPDGLPPCPRSRSRSERATVLARRADELELARLAAQLHALEHDIDSARRTSRPQSIGSLLTGHREPEPPRPHGERARLADGTEILIRPIEPEDAEQLRSGFERLAAVSRYRRFLSEIDHLTHSQLDYLTHVDHQDHEALAALCAATGTGVGIARYVRDPDDGSQAEVAIAVADAWQRRGVGAVLLARLVKRARANGIERVTARMIVGNEAARRLLTSVGEVLDERRLAGTIELTLLLR
jgi:RimJ/RimL family protein N-acetyltransferase